MRRSFVVRCATVAAILAARTHAHAQTTTITVNWNETHQTIDGFGVSQPGIFADWLYSWPEPSLSSLLDMAFKTNGGIGLTIFRTAVPTTLESAPGVWNYTDTAQSWLMREAASRGPVKLMGSVWSPPAWMKSNANETGGFCASTGFACCDSIDANGHRTQCANDPRATCATGDMCVPGSVVGGGTGYYQDYATYLSHYAKEYAAANGVTIYAVSMSNEPDTIDVAWASCGWTTTQIAEFLNNYLTPTFTTNGVSAKVIASEAADWDLVERLYPTFPVPGSNSGPYLSQPEATGAHFDIAAGHLYGGDYSIPFQTAINDGKKIWQTEASLNYPVATITGALSWAIAIHKGLTQAQVNGWLWWALAAGWSNDQALVWSLDNGSTFSVQKAFWALGNFSAFIRPGFVRIGATSSNPDLQVSAYRDPQSNRVVIVAINNTLSSKTVSLAFSGFEVRGQVFPYITSSTWNLTAQPPFNYDGSATVPGRSIVSYVIDPKGTFDILASAPGVHAVSGDFNGDGKYDIALVGGSGWTTIPIAFSNGDGTFWETNFDRWEFAGWAGAPGAQVVVADVNGDGFDDLICSGGSGWFTVPVAFSNGNGTFNVVNLANPTIPGLATTAGVKLLAGDVNDDGRDDIILTAGAGWSTIPVGFSNGDGTFNVTNYAVSQFPIWAQDPYAQATVTDVNGDGRADIVLTAGAGWTTVPVATSLGDGTWSVSNYAEPNLSIWSQGIGAKTLASCRRTVARPHTHPCDVNLDHRGDILLTGGPWSTIPVAFSYGNGAFYDTNATVSSFPGWAQDSSAKVVSGDFNNDGRADLALVGGTHWFTIPVATSNGDGSFNVTNAIVP